MRDKHPATSTAEEFDRQIEVEAMKRLASYIPDQAISHAEMLRRFGFPDQTGQVAGKSVSLCGS